LAGGCQRHQCYLSVILRNRSLQSHMKQIQGLCTLQHKLEQFPTQCKLILLSSNSSVIRLMQSTSNSYLKILNLVFSNILFQNTSPISSRNFTLIFLVWSINLLLGIGLIRFHDNSSADISSTTLRLQTFRLQTFRLLL